MASLKTLLKVLVRSGSPQFARDYAYRGAALPPATLRWNGARVAYRPGTSDADLIYKILLKSGRKGEYAPPPDARLDPASVRVVLDIGANIGISAVYFARLFPNAVVHAFEPVPGNCELLRANAAGNDRVKVHPFALGAEDGELRLYHSDDPINFGGFSAHAAGSDTSRYTAVPVKHAGRALAALGIDKADVIKIDTEGNEWEILTAIDPALLGGVRLVMGELHGRRDFALLDFLQPTFNIGATKSIRNRLFNFYAVNRRQS